MRRKEKSIEAGEEIDRVIEGAQVCRLAMAPDGEPCLVPLNFGYDRHSLYFHSSGDILYIPAGPGGEDRRFPGGNRVDFGKKVSPAGGRWGIMAGFLRKRIFVRDLYRELGEGR